MPVIWWRGQVHRDGIWEEVGSEWSQSLGENQARGRRRVVYESCEPRVLEATASWSFSSQERKAS